MSSPSAITAALLLLLLFLLPLSSVTSYSTTTHSFPAFNDPSDPHFIKTGDASINQGAFQLTPDSLNNPYEFLVNKSGRILLNQPFKLWEDSSSSNSTSKYVASFNTTFNMNVYRKNGTYAGEGLAFIVAPSTDPPPPGSEGGYLGLTNATLDGSPANHLVAVEFDTVKQTYDPNGNHVGLDVNSVISNVTNLTPLGFEIAPLPAPAVIYTVWINYSGAARRITVYMVLAPASGTIGKKPTAPVLNASLDIGEVVEQWSYFGFAAATGSNYELNCILLWNLTVEDIPNGGRWAAWKYALAVGLPLLAAAAAVVLLIGYVKQRRKSEEENTNVVDTLKSLPGMPREFNFKEMVRATNNFDELLKLGQGGFGVVFKGVIPGEQTEVAVKKFSRERMSSQDDFLKELTIINRLRHKHLVRLAGWCHKNEVLLLVYDYMPNGSLDQHLFGGQERPLLSWERRYNIIAGLACALHYLHDEFDQMVVHRDLKASNVMLDADFNARLGDFGLARAIETDKTSYAEAEFGGVPGTIGYIAPECFLTGKATRPSDVFGFGAVVLEVVCGRRPRCDVSGFPYLSEWVWKLHRDGVILDAVDPRLAGSYVPEEAERLLLLGLACSHPIAGDRPKAQAIVQVLSGSVAPPPVPPYKPAFVWPSGPVDDDDDSTALTSTVLTSSYYGQSSSGWSPRGLSREDPVTPVGGNDYTI